MEPRGGREELSTLRAGVTPTPAPRAKRKKVRPTTAPSGSQPLQPRPIPQPYLARAPKPISSYSSTSLDQAPTSSSLVLPSSYRRPTTNGDAGPSTARNSERERDRERFANGLLAPPAIRAGANSRNRPITPNAAAAAAGASGAPGSNGRRRQADRAVRGLGAGNPSMTSLGHLGRILEADPAVAAISEEQVAGQGDQIANPPTARRRRRIVRGDDSPGVGRRLTVSSREEGRALGLARGASMRRLNVWDDLPENTDAPPPFPFPTTSSARLPPTFQSTEQALPPVPSSPPPTFEQAIGLAPLPRLEEEAETIRPLSRASTRYMSAPSSPVLTALESLEDSGELSEEERSDRRMWNADLLAGYTLEERVQREMNRKQARDGESGSAAERTEPAEAPVMTREPEESSNVGSTLGTQTTAVVLAAEPPEQVQDSSPAEHADEMEPDPEPTPPPADLRHAVTAPKIEEHHADVSEATAANRETNHPSASTGTDAMPGGPSATSPNPSRPTTSGQIPISSAPEADESVRPENESGSRPPTVGPTASVQVEEEAARPTSRPTSPVSTGPVETHDDSLDRTPEHPSEAPSIPEPAPCSSERTPIKPLSPPAKVPTPLETAPPPRREPAKSPVDLHPGSAAMTQNSNRSLPTLSETAELPSPVNEDSAVFGNPGPSRKLTRGKAIRRSSSGLVKSSESPTASAPLFSAARFDFGKLGSASPSTGLTQPPEAPRPFIHRSSAPEIPLAQSYANLRKGRLSEDRGMVLTGGRRLGDAPPPIAQIAHEQGKRTDDTPNGMVIPPHREAALLRRESILAHLARPAPAPVPAPAVITRPKTRSNPTSPRMSEKRASLPSGPLIDFSEDEPGAYAPSSPGASSQGFQALASTNAELLQLLEEEAGQPESSAQAAAKAALVQDIQAQLAEQQQSPTVEETPMMQVDEPPSLPPRPDVQETTKKKKAPPPPPPLRNRKGGAWTAGQKISIVDTATSPITPRPSLRRPANPPPEASPTAPATQRPAPPPLPTRRPPPPPPESDRTSSPSHTSSPPPPLFTRGERPISSFSGTATSDTSSIYDKPPAPSGPIPPPVPPAPWKRFDRSPYRPRGPRPRPPPPPPRPRTWAKVVSDTFEIDPDSHGSRPQAERMHSAGELGLAVNTHDLDDRDSSLTVRSPTRSASERDLLSASRRRVTPRSPEYTDLDVYISRLEGSGREYEGYSHIAQFLGPAKSPAASQDALTTLLPGPITVESRRTTKDGKVKLKLSLLGVRVTKCPICLAQFREKEMGVLLPVCGHLGHEECARRWFREDDRCFVCRVKLKAAEGVV